MKRDDPRLRDCRNCGHLVLPYHGGWMHLEDGGLSLHCPGATEADGGDL